VILRTTSCNYEAAFPKTHNGPGTPLFFCLFLSIVCLAAIFLLEQLLRVAANHENQIAIRLYAQSAHVLRDLDHDERTTAS
jgi:hypothetical protein